MIFYLISLGYIGARMDAKRVEVNLLTILILLCPILNTVLALYFLHKDSDYKKSIKRLFDD
nr:MAG TPA: hypothetical protein [Crassvirales sp.]